MEVRYLGAGGQGRVVAVRDAARGGQIVALKETAAGRAQDLRREFGLLAQLRHPNLVAVYDWFSSSPLATGDRASAPNAYTQEYVEGVDLWSALRHAPEELRTEVFEQVLRALAHLHALGVVHLDLKPDNVLVTAGQRPVARVLDFGIAHAAGDAPTAVAGSPSYIAPERLEGRPFDHRADLYALGVMMAEVWLGEPPPRDALAGPLGDPDARRAFLADRGVPVAWLDLVVAATSRDPCERPAHVFAAAALWGRGLGRTPTLHTPGTIAAIVRQGEPAGRMEALERCAAVTAGTAAVITGTPGSGRRTVALSAGRAAQVAGHSVEWWPGSAALRSAQGFSECLHRLLGGAPLELASGADSGDEGAYNSWLEEASGAYVAQLLERPLVEPVPVLVVPERARAPRLVGAIIDGLVDAAEAGTKLPFGLLVCATEHAGLAHVALRPLDLAAVEAFVTARLGWGEGEHRLGAMLAAASGGHPLHLETLLALLVERGELRFGPDGWRWQGGGARFELPEGFGDAVRQRVEHLGAPRRAALEALCWLRFPATPTTLAAALDLPKTAIEADLIELEAAGLVWHDADGRYRLAHRTLAEVLAGWLPPGGAAAGHARTLARGELDKPQGLPRAWHLGGAEGAQMAVALGDAARAGGRLEDAEDALELALELAGDDVEALQKRAAVANLLGPRSRQIACLEALLNVLHQSSPRRLQAATDLFWALTRVGDVERAESVGRDVLVLAEAHGDLVVQTECLVHLATVANQRGDHSAGEGLLRRALAGATELDRPGLLARVNHNLGNVFAYRHAHEAALTHYARAHELKVVEGDPVGQRIALGNMGLMCLRLGRSAEALSHFAASFAAARTTGHRRGEAWSLLALAVLGLEAGALQYAARRAKAALQVAEELGDRLVACDAETTLAEVALAAGDPETARRVAAQGLARAEAVHNRFTQAAARSVLAAAWLDVDPDQAAALAGDVWESGAGDEMFRGSAARVMAEAAVKRGDLDAAAAAARAALDVGERGLTPLVTASVERVLRLVGDHQAADRLILQARQRVAKAAAGWPLEARGDGVDEQSAVDGPSRRTYQSQPAVRRWLLADAADGDVLAEVEEGSMSGDDAAATATLGRRGWGERLAVTSVEELEELAGAWLADLVTELAAERGFLVSAPDGAVVAARDADGEAVSAPDKKVPEAAVEQAVATGAVWVGSGGAGRGSVAALPVRIRQAGDAGDAGGDGDSVTLGGVVVLQNRFVADAFASLSGTNQAADLGGAAVVLRLRWLHARVGELRERLDRAEAARGAELTRSTEEILSLRRQLESTREQVGPAHQYSEIVFGSSAMKRMLRRVDRVIESSLPVYVHGESGTGKELVAQAIHANGPRARGPFVAQNCSAVPRTLFESEFFGHERGAFTGADRPSEGLFRRANGGTLFLDEIGDLPLDLQAKLLRVLETGEVRPVGGPRTFAVDVRVICATHRDLRDQVRDGAFREDLYYRLNVVRVDIPPLRERPEDIPLLVEHFLAARRKAAGPGAPATELGAKVMKALIAYAWPGNVRQLENEITRAALLCDGDISVEDLSDEVRAARRAGGIPSDAELDRAFATRLGLDRGTLKERVDRLEAFVLSQALQQADGNKSAVARELGLSRAGLNMKLKRLDLWDDAKR